MFVGSDLKLNSRESSSVPFAVSVCVFFGFFFVSSLFGGMGWGEEGDSQVFALCRETMHAQFVANDKLSTM